MKNPQTLILLVVLASFLAVAHSVYCQQAPKIEWAKCYGGSGDDRGESIIATNDSGYAIAVTTFSSDGDISGFHGGVSSDGWVIKLTQGGVLEWQKCFGGAEGDNLSCIKQTSDNGYIVSGNSQSMELGTHGNAKVNNPDAWVLKLDSSGNLEWQRFYGGSGGENANSIIQTFDGGYVFAGEASAFEDSVNGDVSGYHGGNADAWIVKLSSNGNIEWQRCVGGDSDDVAGDIIQTSDSGFAVTGFTKSNDQHVSGNHGGSDGWIVKLNGLGDTKWQKCLGGSGDDDLAHIIQTNEGGYAVSGWTTSIDGDVLGKQGKSDIWIVKLTLSGNIEWQKCLGGDSTDYGNYIIQTSDGSYVVTGLTSSINGGLLSHGSADALIAKLSNSGEVQWEKCFGGTDYDGAVSVIQRSDGGYTFVGGVASNNDDVSGNHGSFDVWVVKLAPADAVQTQPSSLQSLPLSTYPNPTTNTVTIAYDLPSSSPVSISIYSITGERMKDIREVSEESGHHEMQIDLGGFPDGSYFISVSACGMTERRMVQVVK